MNPILVFDFAGIAVFAATGALAASRKQLDIVGFLFLASVTAIGGGTFRDLILGAPVFWVVEPAVHGASLPWNSRMLVLSSSGELLEDLALPGSDSANETTLGADGSIYVVEETYDDATFQSGIRVHRYDFDGAQDWDIVVDDLGYGNLGAGGDLAIGAGGRIYVESAGLHVFDAAGAKLWNIPGSTWQLGPDQHPRPFAAVRAAVHADHGRNGSPPAGPPHLGERGQESLGLTTVHGSLDRAFTSRARRPPSAAWAED